MENEAQEKIEYVNEEDSSTGSPQGTAEQKVKQLRTYLRHCKKVRAEYLDGWQRARAEFQNYIKQADGEMRDFRKFASENVISQIIPILDNVILACESIPESIAENNWVKGVAQIRRNLASILKDNGVEEIAVNHGDVFDPAYHEAAREAESGGESGTITEVLQRGYTLHGKVIRPARVKVMK